MTISMAPVSVAALIPLYSSRTLLITFPKYSIILKDYIQENNNNVLEKLFFAGQCDTASPNLSEGEVMCGKQMSLLIYKLVKIRLLRKIYYNIKCNNYLYISIYYTSNTILVRLYNDRRRLYYAQK